MFDIPIVHPDTRELIVTAHKDGGEPIQFIAHVRIDTPNEFAYFQNGGILHYVLRNLAR
jgi:aconitate hydratase